MGETKQVRGACIGRGELDGARRTRQRDTGRRWGRVQSCRWRAVDDWTSTGPHGRRRPQGTAGGTETQKRYDAVNCFYDAAVTSIAFIGWRDVDEASTKVTRRCDELRATSPSADVAGVTPGLELSVRPLS